MIRIEKKKWYKRWWAICIWIFLGLGFLGALFGEDTTTTDITPTTPNQEEKTTQPVTVQETPKETEEKGTLEEMRDAMQEAKENIEDYQEKTDKLDECTKLCAGEDYDIPAVKDQCWLSCYEIHYYGGMEALDDYIEELKNE